jgi:F0F1-type ATP synthase membrane subunit c/vacuolar-type H+-ATPase subunit K
MVRALILKWFMMAADRLGVGLLCGAAAVRTAAGQGTTAGRQGVQDR